MRSSPEGPRPRRLAGLAGAEIQRAAGAFVVVAALTSGATAACKAREGRSTPPGPDASASAAPDLRAKITRAENDRRAQDVPIEAQRGHDPTLRRLAARAFARILDADDTPLVRALEDDDDEVVAWAAYGLGETCKGRTDAHVRALAARLASLPRGGATRAVNSALRALGRCGGDAAEQTLRAWLRGATPDTEAAALGLGEAAALRGSLSLETAGALIEAALGTTPSVPDSRSTAPLSAALYAFGRVDGAANEGLATRLLGAARASLGRPGPDRIFAVRALGRTISDEAPGELGKVLASAAFSEQERAEAARALARLHGDGQAALADALATLVPDRAERLSGDAFGVLLAAVQAVAEDPPKKAETPLWAIARLEPSEGAAPALLRRASALRCAAAVRLARGAWDSDILRGCDVGDGEAGDRARVESLDRGPFTKTRRTAWGVLAHSSAHPRVREAALEVIGRHAELGDSGRAALADALASDAPGVVAVAAEVVQAHPDRVFVLAESERKAALDPRAPPPSANPAREVDPAVASALRAAAARAWSRDLVETRVALLDAVVAAGLAEGVDLARAACKDTNTTVRARAARALAAAGEKDARCPAPGTTDAADVGALAADGLTAPLRVALDTDAGTLGIRLDPALAPLAAGHIAALARSGFYTGVVVHRVVEGFVVQFGDRGGDGYGGSGDTLQCETGPLPFAPLDVGLALAGRDTGSSQIFVALARYPHLDGEYPWLGRADGDWTAVAEGDVIRAVRVED
jgi:cyclophilin family peptidyl-prolyl cis-trans isomerase